MAPENNQNRTKRRERDNKIRPSQPWLIRLDAHVTPSIGTKPPYLIDFAWCGAAPAAPTIPSACARVNSSQTTGDRMTSFFRHHQHSLSNIRSPFLRSIWLARHVL